MAVNAKTAGLAMRSHSRPNVGNPLVLQDYESPGNRAPHGPGDNWARLTALEPALVGLEKDLRSAMTRSRYDCIDKLWVYGGFKRRMTRLVGWQAAHPALRTEGDYSAAYSHLWSILESNERRTSRSGR